MKLGLTFKTPDVLDQIQELVDKTSCEFHEEYDEGCGDCSFATDQKADEIRDKLSKFIRYGEYVTIEFDTDQGTATVAKVKK